MPGMFEDQWPTTSGPIKSDTSTAGTGTKKDSYSHTTAWGGLAGNQVVPQSMVDYNAHLPYSPAGGAPLHDEGFGAGHAWTEAYGKVHDGAGPGNNPW